jgi:uncharacterized protein
MKSSESWIVGAPNRHLFGAGVCDDYGPRNVPEGLTEPGPLTDEATPHGVLVNVLGPAVPAFIVTALVSGKAGVRDLARRSFRWRVPLRWYLISLFAPLLIFLIASRSSMRAAARSRRELAAAVHRIPAGIGDHDLAEQCRRRDRLDRIRLRPIPRSSWSAPRRPADYSVLLAVPRFELLCRHAIMGDDGASAGPLPAPAPGQPIDHWLALQRRGSSVLIAGLFHSMHNAIVNSTGLVAVFGLPQFEALVIMDGIIVLAAAIIAVATRGRLGLKRPESDADLNSGC